MTTAAGKHSNGSAKAKTQTISLFIDGAGSRPDGKGSAFAWLREDTGERHVERRDGLTNNEAEYLALYAALGFVPEQSTVDVQSDSDLVCQQFNGRYKVREPRLAELLRQIQELIEKRKLSVTVGWVPRQQNAAGKLL